jgi:hypothetical protein
MKQGEINPIENVFSRKKSALKTEEIDAKASLTSHKISLPFT